MSKIIISIISFISILPAPASPQETIRQYMSFICGDKSVDINKICHTHPDIWMIPGKKNTAAITKAKNLKVTIKKEGIYMAVIDNTLTFIEIKDGKIDPKFTLDPIYTMQKALVLEFIYHSLLRDHDVINKLVTTPNNIDFSKAPEIQLGNADQYYSIIEVMPVLRSSSAEEDAKTNSITYRIPIGKKGFQLTLKKINSYWKIDTSKKITLPSTFFQQ